MTAITIKNQEYITFMMIVYGNLKTKTFAKEDF